ncbi:hypothetical protein SDC9_128011 [bioreactor metagenome]|uniref:Uncharacterized protein n=1 Tax=bioreactor metagenome TaxID=1076179 RepID=A0A645CUX6_9ZZZZ
MTSRPGKSSREKAKAARMVVMAVAATLDAVTTTELIKYFSKGAVLKAMRKLSKFIQLRGDQVGG